MKTISVCRRSPAAFTLMELLIVISIMALLASLTMMGFSSAQVNASRNRTSAFHRAIMSGLEAYHSDNGEYPEPRSGGKTTNFGKGQYEIGGALMLYQALSGDGDDEIKSSSGSRNRSNGKIDNDKEIAEIKLKEMPREMWKSTSSDEWVIVDGFGHPFQYTYPKHTGAAAGTPSTTTVNTTYDLWSYAEDDKHTQKTSLGDKQDVNISGKWIKNW
jgi:prepilin-type N-terminal cleavage/methylation domain-containing protein